MPTAVLDGIPTRYDVVGDGPPLLMFSPGGFGATLDAWRSQGIYARLRLLETLSASRTCVVFVKREAGQSGGRLAALTWEHYARQGLALLDHLGIQTADLMGGCVGCSIATSFATRWPERTRSLILYSPAGGPRYRLGQHDRIATHLAFLAEHGIDEVVELARTTSGSFSKEPRIGPWGAALRHDEALVEQLRQLGADRYRLLVWHLARTLFDRDTVPGPGPEELMLLERPALVVPGQDASHAPSAARYLVECLPDVQLWDVPVIEQTVDTVPPRLLAFLSEVPDR
ncbi:MAG: alpha/beta fold hydrolase [Actinomycetes bacterium]